MHVVRAARKPAPRELTDLPYADHLEPFDGELTEEGDHDCVHVDGAAFDDAEAHGSRFMESAFTSVTFTGGRMRRSRFNDVWMHTVRFVATDLVETDWMDAEIVAGSLAGLELYGSVLRRVTFHNCKLDSVNLRAAALHDVTFADCLLRDVDFHGARLSGVTFPGSNLEGVRFAGAKLQKTDFRQAVALGITDGFDALRGATVSTSQLLDLAPLLAQSYGIEVLD